MIGGLLVQLMVCGTKYQLWGIGEGSGGMVQGILSVNAKFKGGGLFWDFKNWTVLLDPGWTPGLA